MLAVRLVSPNDTAMLNGEQWQRMLEAPFPRIRTSRIHMNVNRLNVVNVIAFSCIYVDWEWLLRRDAWSIFWGAF